MNHQELIEWQHEGLEQEEAELHLRYRNELHRLAETALSMANRDPDTLAPIGSLESSMADLRKLREAEQQIGRTKYALKQLLMAFRMEGH